MNECGFNIEVDQQELLSEHVRNLDKVNYQIAELKRIKDLIEKQIIIHTGRASFDDEGNIIHVEKEGAETQVIDKYKVTIKTDKLYRINKNEYEIIEHTLRDEFNPVKKEFKYSINKSVYNNVLVYGSEDDKMIMDSFVEIEFAKPSVIVRVNA